MSSIINKIEQKLGDHPNASSNPDVNPESGTGKYANQGHDAGKSDIQNRIQAGMGGERDDETISAGSTTAPDTGNAAQAKHLTDGN